MEVMETDLPSLQHLPIKKLKSLLRYEERMNARNTHLKTRQQQRALLELQKKNQTRPVTMRVPHSARTNRSTGYGRGRVPHTARARVRTAGSQDPDLRAMTATERNAYDPNILIHKANGIPSSRCHSSYHFRPFPPERKLILHGPTGRPTSRSSFGSRSGSRNGRRQREILGTHIRALTVLNDEDVSFNPATVTPTVTPIVAAPGSPRPLPGSEHRPPGSVPMEPSKRPTTSGVANASSLDKPPRKKGSRRPHSTYEMSNPILNTVTPHSAKKHNKKYEPVDIKGSFYDHALLHAAKKKKKRHRMLMKRARAVKTLASLSLHMGFGQDDMAEVEFEMQLANPMCGRDFDFRKFQFDEGEKCYTVLRRGRRMTCLKTMPLEQTFRRNLNLHLQFNGSIKLDISDAVIDSEIPERQVKDKDLYCVISVIDRIDLESFRGKHTWSIVCYETGNAVSYALDLPLRLVQCLFRNQDKFKRALHAYDTPDFQFTLTNRILIAEILMDHLEFFRQSDFINIRLRTPDIFEKYGKIAKVVDQPTATAPKAEEGVEHDDDDDDDEDDGDDDDDNNNDVDNDDDNNDVDDDDKGKDLGVGKCDNRVDHAAENSDNNVEHAKDDNRVEHVADKEDNEYAEGTEGNATDGEDNETSNQVDLDDHLGSVLQMAEDSKDNLSDRAERVEGVHSSASVLRNKTAMGTRSVPASRNGGHGQGKRGKKNRNGKEAPPRPKTGRELGVKSKGKLKPKSDSRPRTGSFTPIDHEWRKTSGAWSPNNGSFPPDASHNFFSEQTVGTHKFKTVSTVAVDGVFK